MEKETTVYVQISFYIFSVVSLYTSTITLLFTLQPLATKDDKIKSAANITSGFHGNGFIIKVLNGK